MLQPSFPNTRSENKYNAHQRQELNMITITSRLITKLSWVYYYNLPSQFKNGSLTSLQAIINFLPTTKCVRTFRLPRVPSKVGASTPLIFRERKNIFDQSDIGFDYLGQCGTFHEQQGNAA